jgi:hypothetical protein
MVPLPRLLLQATHTAVSPPTIHPIVRRMAPDARRLRPSRPCAANADVTDQQAVTGPSTRRAYFAVDSTSTAGTKGACVRRHGARKKYRCGPDGRPKDRLGESLRRRTRRDTHEAPGARTGDPRRSAPCSREGFRNVDASFPAASERTRDETVYQSPASASATTAVHGGAPSRSPRVEAASSSTGRSPSTARTHGAGDASLGKAARARSVACDNDSDHDCVSVRGARYRTGARGCGARGRSGARGCRCGQTVGASTAPCGEPSSREGGRAGSVLDARSAGRRLAAAGR